MLDLWLMIFFVMLNAFFIGAEYSFVRLVAFDEDPHEKGRRYIVRAAFKIAENREKFIYTIRVGLTVAGLGAGIAAYKYFLHILMINGLPPGEISTFFLIFAYTLSVSMIFVIFGYVLPKEIAEKYYKFVAFSVSIPLIVFRVIFYPAAIVSEWISSLLISIFRTGDTGEDERKAVDHLLVALEESEKSGVIDEENSKFIENVIGFADTPVKHIMVPRSRIMAIERGEAFDDMINTIMDEGFSRVPVYEKNIDNIVGVIYTKDILSILLNKDFIIIEDALRTPFYVSEDEKIDKVLKMMQKFKIHLVIVTDRFGSTSGLVTLEDIIEEIVGDIRDEYDDEEIAMVQTVAEGEYIVRAEIRVSDLNEILPGTLPENEDYESLGGFIMYETGRIPAEGDILDLFGYEIEILEAEKNYLQIVKLRLKVGEYPEIN